jgi:hypothetical protein
MDFYSDGWRLRVDHVTLTFDDVIVGVTGPGRFCHGSVHAAA